MPIAYRFLLEIAAAPCLGAIAFLARFFRKAYDVGIGPDPIVSHRFQKRALEMGGYRVQTFCLTPYYITGEFDVIGAPLNPAGDQPGCLRRILGGAVLLWQQYTRYRCLFLSFHGGVLRATVWLWRLEPFLLRLAGVRTVILPYGSDVQDMACSPNLVFKNALTVDYPTNRRRRLHVRRRVDLWSSEADHVVGGCEWVDYMHGWDTLTLAHFTLDADAWAPNVVAEEPSREAGRALVVLHAPNHRAIKGTPLLETAIEELRREGEQVELRILERVPNERIKEVMQEADIVADQFVVGWYAMFALEGMAMGKPVLCYCRPDLEELFISAGLIEKGELPVVNCSAANLKDQLRALLRDRCLRAEYGRRGREFVGKHHSIQAMSKVFGKVLLGIGLPPRA